MIADSQYQPFFTPHQPITHTSLSIINHGVSKVLVRSGAVQPLRAAQVFENLAALLGTENDPLSCWDGALHAPTDNPWKSCLQSSEGFWSSNWAQIGFKLTINEGDYLDQ